MDRVLADLRQAFPFMDDNLIVTVGTAEEHATDVREVSNCLKEHRFVFKKEKYWGLELFRNYIIGKPVKVLTDHKALVSVIRDTAGKTFSSRLTRWIDRLAFYDTQIEHQPGELIGLADYFSRHPVGAAAPPDLLDERF